MSQFQLYGLGNALVDIDVSVDESFLTDLAIDKGVMTLVDENKHHQLVEKLSDLAQKHSCGGSAANTLIAFSQLGGNGFYSCKVASDPTGDVFVNDLNAHRVDTNLNRQQRQLGVTGKCIVLVTPDAQRTMVTHLGITETLSLNEVDSEAIAASECIYLEGYVVTSDTGRAAAIKAREIAEANQVITSLTLSDPNMVNFFKSGLIEMMGKSVDVLFCNEEEACLFARQDNWQDALDYLKQYAGQIIMTRGEKGAVLYDKGNLNEIKTMPVTAIDTVGAGDVFAGSYLYGITHGYSAIEAIHLANKASAEIVKVHGPRLNDSQIQSIQQP